MKIFKISGSASLVIGLILATLAVLGSSVVLANTSYFPPHSNCVTGTSTSSASQLATSSTVTLTCDSYALSTGLVDPTAIDTSILAVQFRAPQATNQLTIAMQYSIDGIDWYDDNLGIVASTTGNIVIDPKHTYTWIAGGTSTTSKVIEIKTPTRYMRAVFTAAANFATSTVYAEFAPKKQRVQ